MYLGGDKIPQQKLPLSKKNKKWREFTHYDVDKKEMTGLTNEVSEDLRDYLRRRGIKIYTNKPFKSIRPSWMIIIGQSF